MFDIQDDKTFDIGENVWLIAVSAETSLIHAVLKPQLPGVKVIVGGELGITE